MRHRKLKTDLANAEKAADQHKQLAHTVSKSYALTISENEQLLKAVRHAQHSIHRAQQQSRHHQEESQRLRRELDEALQVTAVAEAGSGQQHKPDGGADCAAAAECSACGAEQAHQKDSTCQQDKALKLQKGADQAKPHRSAAGQHVLDENEGAQDQNDIDLTVAQDRSKTVQLATGLQHKVASLEHKLKAVTAQLLAVQQTLQATQQQQQDYQHAFRFAFMKLQQSEVSLQHVVKLQEDLKSAILQRRRGMLPCASHDGQQAKCNSTTAHVDHEQILKAQSHKRPQDGDSHRISKRHKSPAKATA